MVIDLTNLAQLWLMTVMTITFAATGIIACSLTGILFTLPGFLAQCQSRHTALLSLSVALILINGMSLINATIWHDPEIQYGGRVLCDIEIKLERGLEMVIVGSTACLFRQLSVILDPTKFAEQRSKLKGRISIAFQCLFLIVFPVMAMGISYLGQSGRYWIVGEQGCKLGVRAGWVGILCVWTWPVAVGACAAWYATRTLWRLVKYQKEVASLLAMNKSNGNRSRTIRLCFIAGVVWIAFVPSRVYFLCANLPTYGQGPNTRLDVEYTDQRTIKFTTLFPGLYATTFGNALCGVAAFACIGCGRDAVETYKKWYHGFRYLVKKRACRPQEDSRSLPGLAPAG